MSKTRFIEYGGDGFWAYDVAMGVFLKHLIDQACRQVERQTLAWLTDSIDRWRENAVVPDVRLYLDPGWTDDQRRLVRTLIDDACRDLEKSESISAEEAASWKILDGQGIVLRGAAQIPTAPAVELGRAIGLLLEGALPEAPPGSWWLYGVEDGVSTIQKMA
jgi:hypothetical protein